jgi:hypothetical protein
MLKKTSEVVQAAGLAPLIVSIFTKLAVLVPPWLMLGVLYGFSAISNAMWGNPSAVAWAAMAGTLATVTLTGLTWLVSHARGPIGRIHSTVSTFGGMAWFTVATITGVTAQGAVFVWFFGGFTLALGWNIRAVIRTGSHGDGPARGGDALKQLFDSAKESFGLKGATVKTKQVTDRKIEAVLELPAGEKIVDDAVKKARYIESGMHLPPGSVNVTGDRNDAARATFTISDPRLMDELILWPGPSRPGGSIAEPLQVGMFQDAEVVEFLATRANVQVMGASGSGKSLFAAWNMIGEAVTRYDVAVFGCDLAKDIQTFGPLRPAMHGVHVTKAKVVEFINALHAEIPRRTKWLSEHGFSDWEPGCGLLFWLVSFEEIAKLFDELSGGDRDKVEQIAKEIRSAGGRIATSLQRSTHTEMPTIVRSQMGFWCFGLNDKDDNEFGLSDAQQEAGANPAQWGAGKIQHIGKAFIDLPGIPESHIALPMRSYAYGPDLPSSTAAMREHAAKWPAESKPIDEFTLRLARIDDAFSARLHAAGGPTMLQVGDSQAQAPAARAAEGLGELLAHAAALVVTAQYASSEMLSRKLRVGHADALQILDALEMKGVVGPQPANGQRAVLIGADDAEGLVESLQEDGFPIAEYLRTDDPDPEVAAGPYDEIRTPTLREDPFYTAAGKPPAKLPPERARAIVHAWIRDQGLDATFTATHEDLTRIRQETGNTSRGWINKVLNELAAAGALDKDTSGPAHRFTVADLGPLGRVMVDA